MSWRSVCRLIGVILQSGTLDIYTIVEQQSGYLGMTGWNMFCQPLGFIIYLIAAIAETNRVPFDLPEAETELVAGFHTEYSSMKFLLFFNAEYINMITVSMLATTLFLGGWNGPFVAAIAVARRLLLLRQSDAVPVSVHLAARNFAAFSFRSIDDFRLEVSGAGGNHQHRADGDVCSGSACSITSVSM